MATTTITTSRSHARPRVTPSQDTVEIVAPPSRPNSFQKSSTPDYIPEPEHTKEIPPADSILLQGNPRVADKFLWLLPDGSGSVAPYTAMGKIEGSVAVIGLQCPYMKHPDEMNCSIKDLVPSYINEVRRRQPSGPYYFGGWSTGGILAFQVAQALQDQGEKIERLILIDTPCPIHRKWRPTDLSEDLKDMLAFGRKSLQMPTWMYRHYDRSLESLQKYRVRPFEPYMEPSTHLIYARRGLSETVPIAHFADIRDEPEEIMFIVSKRKVFGPSGWDKLLNPDDIQVGIVGESDHFSMLRGDGGRRLAELISASIAQK